MRQTTLKCFQNLYTLLFPSHLLRNFIYTSFVDGNAKHHVALIRLLLFRRCSCTTRYMKQEGTWYRVHALEPIKVQPSYNLISLCSLFWTRICVSLPHHRPLHFVRKQYSPLTITVRLWCVESWFDDVQVKRDIRQSHPVKILAFLYRRDKELKFGTFGVQVSSSP